MKKLLKSEICGSVNITRDAHVAENWLKGQTFRLKKKKKKVEMRSAKRASQTHPKSLKAHQVYF